MTMAWSAASSCEGADVTRTIRAQAALGASEARWRRLFERLHEGFVLAELLRAADGSAIDHRIVEVNAAWEAQTGIPVAVATGGLASEFFPEDEPFLDRALRPGAGDRDFGQYRASVLRARPLARPACLPDR